MSAAAIDDDVPSREHLELRATVLSRIHTLTEDDLRVLAAILGELPAAVLIERIEMETRLGVEGAAPVKLDPVSRRSWARALLLQTWDAWRALIKLPARPRRLITDYLHGVP